MPLGTGIIAVPLYFTQYKLETDDLIIVLATRRPINITVNKKTRVALDGRSGFLIDDDGKEKQLRVVYKKAKKPPAP